MKTELIQHMCESMRGHCLAVAPEHAPALRRIIFRVNENLTSCAGRATYDTFEVEISGPIFRQTPIMAQLVDTILHEIAHVLCPHHGHDATWIAMAQKLGCTAERTHMMPRARKIPKIAQGLDPLDL